MSCFDFIVISYHCIPQRPGLLERMPAIKDNPQNPEEFNNIPNGDVAPSTGPVKGMISNT